MSGTTGSRPKAHDEHPRPVAKPKKLAATVAVTALSGRDLDRRRVQLEAVMALLKRATELASAAVEEEVTREFAA